MKGIGQTMWTRHRKRRKLGRLIVPVISAAVLSYFGYHSIHGGFGLRAQERMIGERAELQARFDDLRSERKALEKRVMLLKDGSIERDMLDEQARRALNKVRPDDLVIMR